MERLTERELNAMDCASYTKCNTDECVGYCGGCNAEEEAKLKLKHYEDLEEQGLLIKLPCKLNEMVYIAHKKYPTHKGLFVSKADIVSCLEEGYVIGSTKEEALRKLKELENE